MPFPNLFVTACAVLATAVSLTANAERIVGSYEADGSVSIKPESSSARSANRTGAVLDGDAIRVSGEGSAHVALDRRDGYVTVGDNTRAKVTSEPGYLVHADGDRIDFGFRYGEPFAVQMDCYVVRPHPLQVVSDIELISGSIIRDERGIYVVGRNGRLDVTVNGSYVAHDYARSEVSRFESVAQPDRLHIIEKHDRLRGCGGADGAVVAIPQSCAGG